MKTIYEQLAVQCKEKASPNAYPVHMFIMAPETFNPLNPKIDIATCEVHVGFYDPETKKIVACQKMQDQIAFVEDKPYQDESYDIAQIDVQKAVDIVDILDKAKHIVFEKYTNTLPLKTFFILQHLKEHGFVWNITILRRDFNVLNLKFNAETAALVSESLDSMISQKK